MDRAVTFQYMVEKCRGESHEKIKIVSIRKIIKVDISEEYFGKSKFQRNNPK